MSATKLATIICFLFLFRYDFVDVARQSLQVILIKYYTDLVNAAKTKNIEQLK